MVTINQTTNKQLHDPSARLTLSVENLTFIRVLQFTEAILDHESFSSFVHCTMHQEQGEL